MRQNEVVGEATATAVPVEVVALHRDQEVKVTKRAHGVAGLDLELPLIVVKAVVVARDRAAAAAAVVMILKTRSLKVSIYFSFKEYIITK